MGGGVMEAFTETGMGGGPGYNVDDAYKPDVTQGDDGTEL